MCTKVNELRAALAFAAVLQGERQLEVFQLVETWLNGEPKTKTQLAGIALQNNSLGNAARYCLSKNKAVLAHGLKPSDRLVALGVTARYLETIAAMSAKNRLSFLHSRLLSEQSSEGKEAAATILSMQKPEQDLNEAFQQIVSS